MKVEFFGTMRGKSCINIDDEGEAIIKIIGDASQLHNTVKMVCFKKKLFKVTIQDVEKEEK